MNQFSQPKILYIPQFRICPHIFGWLIDWLVINANFSSILAIYSGANQIFLYFRGDRPVHTLSYDSKSHELFVKH